MNTGDYLSALRSAGILKGAALSGDIPVSLVTNRSADVRPGAVFCAIRGSKFDGHDYLEDAQKNGAVLCVVHESRFDNTPGTAAVSDSFLAWGVLCQTAAGDPAKQFRVHGITGTNGKTTTALLLRHFLTVAGQRRCGVLTTVFTDICAESATPAAGTMPDAAALQKLFAGFAENRGEDMVMECSSHGLDQSRSGTMLYSCAVFTNLTGDHLDYHRTMEAYYQAKKRLFTVFAAPGMPSVINLDDPAGRRLYDELDGTSVRRIGVSMTAPDADWRIHSVQTAAAGTTFCLVSGQQEYRLSMTLTGLHNVYNMAEAFAAAAALGIPCDVLADAAATAPAAPGRLERFTLNNGAAAFVDYAHTDDALIRVTSALNAIRPADGKLITVFGCGGDRDRTKRPRMGAAAVRHSGLVIVTSDNPRSEDPLAIIQEILPGTENASCPVLVEPDRAAAIALALSHAGPRDLVLIAGKGHEDYQEICGVKHHFDDREQIIHYRENHL